MNTMGDKVKDFKVGRMTSNNSTIIEECNLALFKTLKYYMCGL